MSSIGGNTSHVARRVGGSTADLAKRVGGSTADLAKRVGGSSKSLARRVGPKRGLIGLAVLAAAVGGGVYLARYLRARAEDRALAQGTEAGDPRRARSPSRDERIADNRHATH